MATTAQIVEGYRIITVFLGKEGSIGSDGKEESSPAFSRGAAEEYLASVKALNVTYAFQLIRGAQFVRLLSGEVVDNGKPTVRMYT